MTSSVQREASTEPQVQYETEVRTILRSAAHAATMDQRRVTPDDLRAALAAPIADLPQLQLNKTHGTQAVLDRARELALLRQAKYVERVDLVEALAEAGAVAAGLDLQRLHFVRFALERARRDVIGSLCRRVCPSEADLVFVRQH